MIGRISRNDELERQAYLLESIKMETTARALESDAEILRSRVRINNLSITNDSLSTDLQTTRNRVGYLIGVRNTSLVAAIGAVDSLSGRLDLAYADQRDAEFGRNKYMEELGEARLVRDGYKIDLENARTALEKCQQGQVERNKQRPANPLELPGNVSVQPYFVNSGSTSGGGLSLSRDIIDLDTIALGIDGGFEILDRDTGKWVGGNLSVGSERFGVDFGLGAYDFRDFSQGADADWRPYAKSGLYFGFKRQGLGFGVGGRKISARPLEAIIKAKLGL